MGFTVYITAQDIMQLELLTLFVGLYLASKHNLKLIEVNMDAKQVTNLLFEVDKCTDTSTLVLNYKYLFLQLDNPVVSYVYREQNR